MHKYFTNMNPYLSDKYKFHDNLVHGLSFFTEDFQSEVHLDIDHIINWPSCDGNGSEIFVVSRAMLKFINVTDLFINIDRGKSGYTTSVSGVSIDRIECEEIETTLRLPTYYKWEIVMSDECSRISFGSSDMFFELMGTQFSVNRQYLKQCERN